MTLKEDIEKKLDKLTVIKIYYFWFVLNSKCINNIFKYILQEPPPVKFIKPLPKPIDPGRKKRGGKRVRKMKERYAVTELRKQANRMNFADVNIKDIYIK